MIATKELIPFAKASAVATLWRDETARREEHKRGIF
jgi:hypothetical protein